MLLLSSALAPLLKAVCQSQLPLPKTIVRDSELLLSINIYYTTQFSVCLIKHSSNTPNTRQYNGSQMHHPAGEKAGW